MSFDPLARCYYALETMVFGRALWRTRTRYLGELKGLRRTLVLGDGDGRFTAALALIAPSTEIICLDSSAAMLQATRSRLEKALTRTSLRLVCGDARAIPLANEWLHSCDGIVTHFVLDCFGQSEMDQLAATLAARVRKGCIWVISEFAIPDRWPWRVGGRCLIALLYWFTRQITGLQVNRLPNYTASLRLAGFERKLLHCRWKGLLRSEVWLRGQ